MSAPSTPLEVPYAVPAALCESRQQAGPLRMHTPGPIPPVDDDDDEEDDRSGGRPGGGNIDPDDDDEGDDDDDDDDDEGDTQWARRDCQREGAADRVVCYSVDCAVTRRPDVRLACDCPPRPISIHGRNSGNPIIGF